MTSSAVFWPTRLQLQDVHEAAVLATVVRWSLTYLRLHRTRPKSVFSIDTNEPQLRGE